MASGEASPQAKPTGQFARKVFRELQQSIIQHESCAMAGDVEAIHDMRVGIRRLRVALSNFSVCLPKEDRKRLRASMENLATALGEVRDLDVMIGAMKSKQPNRLAEDRAAINSFIHRLRARRRRRHRRLVVYLQGEEYATFKREFSVGCEAETAFNSDIQELENEQAA